MTDDSKSTGRGRLYALIQVDSKFLTFPWGEGSAVLFALQTFIYFQPELSSRDLSHAPWANQRGLCSFHEDGCCDSLMAEYNISPDDKPKVLPELRLHLVVG